MDFHQSASERFAEQVFKYIIKEFDGKTINSDDCNIDLMIKNLPEGFDDFDLEECLPQVEEQENNEEINTTEHTEVSDSEPAPEVFQDNIESPKKKKNKKDKKKDKKNKKNKESEDNSDKPKRKPNAFIVFRTDPANLDAIIEKANEINEETGKKYGKVKAASILWKAMTEEEQTKWK
jgi:outer membrane biosynthesis protein TonB